MNIYTGKFFITDILSLYSYTIFYAMLNSPSFISISSLLLISLFSAESISVKSIINFSYVGKYLLEKNLYY